MKFKIEILEDTKQRVEQMSLKQLLGILCCPNYMREDQNFFDTATAFIHEGDKEFHKKIMNKITASCKDRPFVCSDFEAGPGTMINGGTAFPSLFSISVTGKPEFAYQMGKIAALEGRELGYNWTLGPAVDICANPDTPTTSSRGAGLTPEEVITYGVQYLKGCQDYGMIATAKHFPGDGFGIYDQHLTTPEIPLTVDEWWRTSGKVYKEVIDSGVMSIMPGHLSFPAYDDICSENGLYPPATISKKLMDNLLRKELGFDGIIISDAVEMVGFSGFMNYYEACAKFLDFGGDILLFASPNDKMESEFSKLIDKGVITLDTLKNRATRVLSFRKQVDKLFKSTTNDFNKDRHEEVAKEVISSSIKVVRDRKKILPIKNTKDKNVLHLIISIPNFKQLSLLESMKTELEREFKSVEQWVDPGSQKIIDAVDKNKFDLIICSVGNDYNFGTNVIRLNGFQSRNLMGGWVHLDTPVIFISHFHPFTHLEYKALMSTVINTYGTVPNTIKILVDKICGKEKLEFSTVDYSLRDWTLREWLNHH
ncbi:hypothetical protein EW093_14840 [Thiospirochaeta perfilievii]|uniref:beta-N-acetylhexosaminidase n=1 Tax=Thiospirochaeta perfilievii TaxID=252967 RepID=A0A5C1QCW8_9SPIO|nr:glycoside hydrolase family 3 N-terminal domain-containing protein [Thiospirochaeta perfilievii]QEN05915.1 hypothetical protein EW093_14840 [Thiospirochaeta perfilievii]